MEIEWKESKIDGDTYYEADYRGMHLVTYFDSPWYGAVYCGGKRISSTPSSDLETMKKKLISIADREAVHADITWHPYPQEVPPRYGEYLVTVSNDLMERTKFIDLWHYCKNDEFQKLGYMLPPEAHVIAWAELPKPYEEKVVHIR